MQDKYKTIIKILLAIITAQSILLLWFIWPKKPKVVYKPSPAPAIVPGKIAIVLDDWGYDLKNIRFLNEIKAPLTIAILPNLAYSSQVAQEARKNRKEIILHIPLEPHKNSEYKLEVDTILISMPEDIIRAILNQALMNLPSVKGISNHMGSQVTEDQRTMKIIFAELKRRRLYFLDSLVTPKTVCKELAEQMRLPFAQRSVFLDNKPDRDYIKNQLKLLMREAVKNGFAVGIGHEKLLTLNVLKDEIPDMEKAGFNFVNLSELVK